MKQTSEVVIKVLTLFFSYLKQQYKIKLKVIEMNEELYTQKPKIKQFLEQLGLQVEPLSLYMQALNEGAKHSESVIK